MYKRIVVAALIMGGVWVAALLVNLAPETEIARARTELQQYPPPSPRPPIDSTPEPPTEPPPPPTEPPPPPTDPPVPPTEPPNQSSPIPEESPTTIPSLAPPRSGGGGGGGGSHATPTPQMGLITGTVIDQSTGAPASGVPVCIGNEILVYSDTSGNYIQYVPGGVYTVELVLEEGEGIALQEPASVSVSSGGAAVYHLFFTSDTQPTRTPTETDTSTMQEQGGETGKWQKRFFRDWMFATEDEQP